MSVHTASPHCLHCGGQAEEIGRVNFTMDYLEITYRCTDPRCRGITKASVRLTCAAAPESAHDTAPIPCRDGFLPRRPGVQFLQEQST